METIHTPPSTDETTWKKEAHNEADRILRRHVAWAAGGGLIPVPFVDVAAVTAIQIDMLKKVSKLYKVEFSDAAGKSWLSTLAVNTSTHIGVSLMKSLPVIGTFGGGLLMSGLSGAGTFALGQVAIRHFEEGGDMTDMEASQYGEYFQEMLEEGKEYVRNKTGWSKQGERDSTYPDPVKRMEDLQKLHKMGAITDEEFETKKAKIMSEL